MIRSCIILAALGALLLSTDAKDLYLTDFEDFNVGSDLWANTEGWLADPSNSGLGVHGIDADIVTGLGQTAFLGPADGTNQPANTLVSVFRSFGTYDPVANNTPIIELETLFGIEFSTNDRHDYFYITIFNSAQATLGAIRFQNNPNGDNRIFRINNAGFPSLSDVTYESGELSLLYIAIDYAKSTWSSSLNGISLFTDAVFNPAGVTADLGLTAAQWQISSGDAALHGDNWMLIADWSVRGIPTGQEPFILSDCGINGLNQPYVSWLEEPEFSYQVEYTEGLLSWTNGLPNAFFTGTNVTQRSYADPNSASSSNRSYRVIRSVTP